MHRAVAQLRRRKLREVEIDENVERLDFDTYEQSAQRLQEWKREAKAKAEEEAAAAKKESRPDSGQASRGPHPTPASVRSISKATRGPWAAELDLERLAAATAAI